MKWKIRNKNANVNAYEELVVVGCWSDRIEISQLQPISGKEWCIARGHDCLVQKYNSVFRVRQLEASLTVCENSEVAHKVSAQLLKSRLESGHMIGINCCPNPCTL